MALESRIAADTSVTIRKRSQRVEETIFFFELSGRIFVICRLRGNMFSTHHCPRTVTMTSTKLPPNR